MSEERVEVSFSASMEECRVVGMIEVSEDM